MQEQQPAAAQQASTRPASTSSGIYYSFGKSRRIGLRPLGLATQDAHSARAGRQLQVGGREDASRLSALVTNAARAKFEMSNLGIEKLFGVRRAAATRVAALPSVFEDETDRRIRLVYKEVVARFAKGTLRSTIDRILTKYGFVIRERSMFAPGQYILSQSQVRYAGVELLDAANRLAELDEVVFAVPNFVSEFRREALPRPRSEQWHLGDVRQHGVRAAGAWSVTLGASQVVVAVLDDGIDLGHPDLRGRLARNPNPRDRRDTVGRDFFVPDKHPDHYNPEPKNFRYPYDEMDGNDIHGTPCAGVAVADGKAGERVFGIAPRCRLLPVKIFHGDELATDSRVADAIRYASRCAAVLSCSWSGPESPDIALALDDARAARQGRGAIVCAATGNESQSSVGYPAADGNVIAVGSSADDGKRADYSNYGAEVSVLAPSSGGDRGIFTTDVSIPNRGFNVGSAAAGGRNGRYTNDFGGTSSATPLVAGVAALLLAADPGLTAEQVKDALQKTARKPSGVQFDAAGFHREYGHGIVDAAAALEQIRPGGGSGTRRGRRRKKRT